MCVSYFSTARVKDAGKLWNNLFYIKLFVLVGLLEMGNSRSSSIWEDPFLLLLHNAITIKSKSWAQFSLKRLLSYNILICSEYVQFLSKSLRRTHIILFLRKKDPTYLRNAKRTISVPGSNTGEVSCRHNLPLIALTC